MDIAIKERKLSFTAEYDITAPDATYYARKAFFSLNDHLELQEAGGRVVATIQGSFSPLRDKHEFTFTDGRIYHFECEKVWKQVYTCEGNGEHYTLYQHKGLCYSIFRDDRQIAAVEKNSVVWVNGNEYQVRMDSDADLMLVVCLVLTINSEDDNNQGNTLTIDFGSIGPEDRPFDENWQPR